MRTCRLGPRQLEEEAAWLEAHRQRWAGRFDSLEAIVQELTRKERTR